MHKHFQVFFFLPSKTLVEFVEPMNASFLEIKSINFFLSSRKLFFSKRLNIILYTYIVKDLAHLDLSLRRARSLCTIERLSILCTNLLSTFFN